MKLGAWTSIKMEISTDKIYIEIYFNFYLYSSIILVLNTKNKLK